MELSTGLFNDKPLCDFISSDPWGENPAPYLMGKRWSYVQCNDCGQAFHKYILAPDWNERRFSQWMTQEAIEAFGRPFKTPEKVFSKAVQYTKHVLQLEHLTRNLRSGKPVRLLDFGCGYGEFIAMCDLYGFEAYGIDRSSAKRENSRFARIFPELEDLKNSRISAFHVITLFEVLEHLDDPRSLLEVLKEYLVTGGILVLETPDCSGVKDIATHDDYRKIHPLEHINGFTPATMRGLAESLGFAPVRKPVSHVTTDPMRVAKTEIKRIVGGAIGMSTQQYFRKLSLMVPGHGVRAELMSVNSNSPVFLVGCERSGTTLLRLMLDHHPDIAFNLESDFLVNQISDDGSFPDAGDYREFLRNDHIFQHSHFEIKGNLDFVAMANDFLEQKRTRDGKAIVGATIHYHFSNIGRIWPKAKYIYLYRDGRDVANSVVGMGWAGNAYVAADWWLEAEMEWERCRGTIPEGSWIEVRYKELIANPSEQLTRICHFLGVEYTDRMFDYAKNSSYGPINPDLIDRWKTKTSKEAVQKIEEKIGDRLLLRGYELSGYPRITISKIEKRYLYLHSRIGAFLYRIQKYGAVLSIWETITRRLGLKGQHARIKRMINKIDDANLK